MVLTTKEASYIIVLGIVISVLSNRLNTPPARLSGPFQTKSSKQKSRGANQTLLISSKQTCPISLLSGGMSKSCFQFRYHFRYHFRAYRGRFRAIPNSNPEANTMANPESNSDHSYPSTLLQEVSLRQWLREAVGEHLSGRYIAQVDLSVSSHICSKIVLGRNVCICSSAVDSVLDTSDQWLCIREHMRDSRDAELVQEMRDLCESHTAYSKGIVFSIGGGLGSRLLLFWSPVNRSSEGDDQSTYWFLVIRASNIVWMNITSMCSFFFSSEMQSPVFVAIEVPKHAFESYHMLIAWVVIVPAENSDGICRIGPSGGYRVHKASDHWVVYGRIAGFFVGVPLVKLHCHWHGNWPGLIHYELRQALPNVAVLKDDYRVMLPIAFDVHAEMEGDTPEIMHPEPLLHQIFDLPNQALVNNDKEIIDVQNDWGNIYSVIFLVIENELSSVNMWCHEPYQDHEVLTSAIPHGRRLLQAIKRVSQA